MSIHAPKLDLRPAAQMEWGTMADIIRFRETTRPAELLTQGVVHTKVGKREVYFLSDPEALKIILKQDSANFPKAPENYRIGYRAFGPSMAGTRGADMMRHRRAFAPVFGGQALRRMAPATRHAAEAAAARWQGRSKIDLSREASRLALELSWSVFLGPGTYEAISTPVAALFERLLSLPKSDMAAQLLMLDELVEELVSTQRYTRLPEGHPLAAIACPHGLTGEAPLSQREVRANALNMALVGYASTGNCLAWGLWVLGQDPVYQEALRTKAASGASISAELEALYSEVLRLWPPAPDASRLAKRALEVEGHAIAPGSVIMVCPYALHRRADIWHRPDAFDPRRFLAHTPAIWPFSGGAHLCPGKSFAWTELITATETLLGRIRLHVAPDAAAQVGLKTGALLDPSAPLMAKLEAV